MRPLAIRTRVAAVFALAMAVVLAATGSFLYLRLGSHLSLAVDRELHLRADDLTALASQGTGSLAAAGGQRFVEHGEAYAQLLDSSGRVLDATRPLGGAAVLTTRELARARRETIYANRDSVPGLDEPSRLLATPIRRRGRPAVLVVGVTRQDRAETLASLRNELLIAGPIALLLATLAGYALAGFSLRPVEAMRRRAAEVSAQTPGERLPVPKTGDELERLGKTLNSMLARLEAALERERAFVADAGHELRTPLALLRTELELALRHGETVDELRNAVRAASEESDRLAQLAEALLLGARSDDGELALRQEDLAVSDLLATVVARFEWRAAEAGRPLAFEAPPDTFVRGDRLRLEQALGNLVDNALRHGRGTVSLEALPDADTVELHVRDEGGGFQPEFLPHAFERFTRPSPDRGGRGSGLGLSIVRTIALAHEGTAEATHAGSGDVWIALPRARIRSRATRRKGAS
jgi:signal transduction histidine kinase